MFSDVAHAPQVESAQSRRACVRELSLTNRDHVATCRPVADQTGTVLSRSLSARDPTSAPTTTIQMANTVSPAVTGEPY